MEDLRESSEMIESISIQLLRNSILGSLIIDTRSGAAIALQSPRLHGDRWGSEERLSGTSQAIRRNVPCSCRTRPSQGEPGGQHSRSQNKLAIGKTHVGEHLHSLISLAEGATSFNGGPTFLQQTRMLALFSQIAFRWQPRSAFMRKIATKSCLIGHCGEHSNCLLSGDFPRSVSKRINC